VSGSAGASRRHRAFDSRWPKRRRPRLVAADRLAPALAGLDWGAFSTHSFPGRRRHDPEAISAYYAYKHGRQAAEAHRPRPKGVRMRLNEPARTRVAKRSSLSETAGFAGATVET
jgi:hypothetical protein